MGKTVLKEFLQSLQNRVIVAVSFAVIKTKPADATGEQHAEKIQQLVYDYWVNDSYVSFFENKIIELQHEKFFKEISDLLGPKEDDKLLLSTLDDSFPGVCSEEYLYDEFYETDSDFGENCLLKNNISFIQALVQLKFTVHSSSSVAVDTINNLRDKFSKNEHLPKNSIKNMVNVFEDFGFSEQCAQHVADLNYNKIRLIMNSSRTEHLIKKCLTSVTQFAYKNICNNTTEIFYSWHGSVMEYLCSVLQDISFHPVCSDCILKLISKCLDDIWSSEDSSKHISWEYQQYILSEFCVNSHVCESVIDFIMVKFHILINLINTIQIGAPEHLGSIHLIEKLPHFILFLSIVIRKFQLFKDADILLMENKVKSNKYEKVTDLWKLKWRVNSEGEFDYKKKIFLDLLKRWKDICENLVILSTPNFPLISVFIWDIMTTLQEWNDKI